MCEDKKMGNNLNNYFIFLYVTKGNKKKIQVIIL